MVANAKARAIGTIPILRQQIDWVGGYSKCLYLMTFSSTQYFLQLEDEDKVNKMVFKKSNKVMAVKRIRSTVDEREQKELLMDLEVVMKSSDCPCIVTFFGAINQFPYSECGGAVAGQIWTLSDTFTRTLSQ